MRPTPVLALLLCLTAAPAAAQFYVGAHGGFSMTSDSALEIVGVRVGTAALGDGATFGGVVGVRLWPNPIRVEGAISYRQNDINDVTGIPGIGSLKAVGVALDAEVTTLAFMANAWYDLLSQGPVRPYLGGGVGTVTVEVEGAVAVPGFALSGSTEDTVLGGQLGAGVAITVLPELDVTLDYRALLTQGANFDGLEAEYTNHSVRAGLRLRL